MENPLEPTQFGIISRVSAVGQLLISRDISHRGPNSPSTGVNVRKSLYFAPYTVPGRQIFGWEPDQILTATGTVYEKLESWSTTTQGFTPHEVNSQTKGLSLWAGRQLAATRTYRNHPC